MREAVRAQASQRLDRVAGKQELLHFVEKPRRGHVLDQRRELRDRRRGLRVDRDVELRGEPHGAQHPHRIFAQAGHRRADQLQLARADVGHAADESQTSSLAGSKYSALIVKSRRAASSICEP